MPIEVKAYVPTVAPGIYQAVCTGVEDKAPKDDPSNIFRVWEFTLRDGSGRTVGASSSIQTTPKSKGGKWLAALMGRAVGVGEFVEPVGQPCTIIVALKDTTGYEFVETVAPPTDAPVRSPVRPLVEEPLSVAENAGESIAAKDDDVPF